MASYRAALQWVALNDDVEFLRDEEPLESVTVCLVADLFGKDTKQVLKDLDRVVKRERGPHWKK